MSQGRSSPSRPVAKAALIAGLAVMTACREEPVAEYVHVPPTPYEFVSSSGDTVQAERGELWVPENRRDEESRSISLAYVRFPSTSPNPSSTTQRISSFAAPVRASNRSAASLPPSPRPKRRTTRHTVRAMFR